MPSPDLEDIQAELASFLASRRTLVLGTLNEDGRVELSVAPFVPHGDGFAVFLSELAPHTANLGRTQLAQVLLLEDEAQVRQPFARTRVSFDCRAERLDRESAQGRAVLQVMEASFGGIVPLLFSLPDFHLFLLTPGAGRFVAGFGRAFRLEGLRVVEHLGR
ncbi:MAG: pyridoxamine 5'-phosphate oxidase family protein [Gammaproteobacteria bacterium]|nr:pyridoxamine 5'-phosphate oxidase family protein [Gammaproteobacteria bacterium]